MRSAIRSRPPLPSTPMPVRDELGRDMLGYITGNVPQVYVPQVCDIATLIGCVASAELAGMLAAAWEHGLTGPQLADALLRVVAQHPAMLGDPVLWAVADCARLAADLGGERAAGPWLVAAQLVAERHATWGASNGIDLPATAEPLRDLLAQACRQPGDLGVAAIAAAKFADLATEVGEASATLHLPLLAAGLRALAPVRAEYAQILSKIEPLRPRLAEIAELRDPAKARAFVEPKFRPHLVDGSVDQAIKACLRAAEVGIPHELLAQGLCLGAAERLLRCDRKWDSDATVDESSTTIAQLVVLASAVRQLQPVAPPAAWLELLLFTAGLIAATAPLDRPKGVGSDLPDAAQVQQTWDHGPEIAKIVSHLHAGRGEAAIAHLRAYFLLVLPEQPLCSQLREAALSDHGQPALEAARSIAVMAAAVDDFQALSGNPHRERVLAAALRYLAEPEAPRSRLAVIETALQRRSLGWSSQSLLRI